MSTNLWIAKHNGTIQCEDIPATPIAADRELLESLIGKENVLDQAEGSIAMARLCGLPTGQVNGFEITAHGWFVLNNGFVGNPGFFLWEDRKFQ